MKSKMVVVITILLLSVSGVYAELHDRGGGLIYDDVLNVTWLQDANYALTSGYDDDGRMSWHQAMEWVDSLEYYDQNREVILDDWRLPGLLPVNPPNYNFDLSYDGSTDRGYNILSENSEMSYMYYINLQGDGKYDTSGNLNEEWWINNSSGPFENLMNSGPSWYWSNTEYYPPSDIALNYSFYIGYQFNFSNKIIENYVWPVRDGDVVPHHSFAGFEPPCDSVDVALTVKKNKCVPLKTELYDGDGFPITDADIEYPPVLILDSFSGANEPVAATDIDGLPPGEATDGNQFEFIGGIGGRWCLNLKVKDFYTAPGTYTFKMVSGNSTEYRIERSGTVTVYVEK